MKPFWTSLALASLAGTAFAAAEPAQQPAQKLPFEGKPAVALQVIDLSEKQPKAVPGNQLSISKKQNQICWVSFNVPVEPKMKIAEAIYAPAAMTLTFPGSKIDSSADGKNHTIISEADKASNQVGHCWTFNQNDPVGKYQFEVQIGNQVFRGLAFEVVK